MQSDLGHAVSSKEDIAAATEAGHAFLVHPASQEIRSFEPDPAILTPAMVAGWVQVFPKVEPPEQPEVESH
jgi:hypothetical protein